MKIRTQINKKKEDKLKRERITNSFTIQDAKFEKCSVRNPGQNSQLPRIHLIHKGAAAQINSMTVILNGNVNPLKILAKL